MTPITSTQNPTYKKLLSLTSSKGLKKEGLFLLAGADLIAEFLKKPHLKIIHEILPPDAKPLTTNTDTLELSRDLFDALDGGGTHHNLLALEQPVLAAYDPTAPHPQGLSLAAPLGDPGNLGALIRSAEAFGASRVILTEEAAHPFLPKAVKASAGSVLRLPLLRGPSLKQFPKNAIALDQGGIPIHEFVWPKDALLIVGEEGAGLGNLTFQTTLTIPTQGVESLNATVAASVALAHRSCFMKRL